MAYSRKDQERLAEHVAVGENPAVAGLQRERPANGRNRRARLFLRQHAEADREKRERGGEARKQQQKRAGFWAEPFSFSKP